jgi:hypothetical protein
LEERELATSPFAPGNQGAYKHMTKQVQGDDASNHKPLALVFLVTFAVIGLASIWLMYAQFAQLYTKAGQCTVLSSQTTQEAVNTDEETDDNALYSVTFKVSLLTADGQHLQVDGYYTSANYTTSDPNGPKTLISQYPVGTTVACGYTYLPFSSVQAIFSPSIPLEGFLFPGFFFVLALVFFVICLVFLRRPPAQPLPFPDELALAEYEEDVVNTSV